jgi:hypothetical protein
MISRFMLTVLLGISLLGCCSAQAGNQLDRSALCEQFQTVLKSVEQAGGGNQVKQFLMPVSGILCGSPTTKAS